MSKKKSLHSKVAVRKIDSKRSYFRCEPLSPYAHCELPSHYFESASQLGFASRNHVLGLRSQATLNSSGSNSSDGERRTVLQMSSWDGRLLFRYEA